MQVRDDKEGYSISISRIAGYLKTDYSHRGRSSPKMMHMSSHLQALFYRTGSMSRSHTGYLP